MERKIIFLTGTRADFGKIKPLVKVTQDQSDFEVHLFVTGMHMNPKYGYTVHEVKKSGVLNIYRYINGKDGDTLDETLKNTISGFGQFVRMEKPDLIVVHGDRVEALAGALVGSLNNVPVAHIEGGEVSGTIDEHIRHAVSKLSHLHFVANNLAKKRLMQLGEKEDSIYVIGSPDIDIMCSKSLPTIDEVKKRYDFKFDSYGLFTFHPVTTEIETLRSQVNQVSEALIESDLQYIGVFPNNDPGTDIVLDVLKEKLFDSDKFKFYPSIRFEYFLTMIKNASFVIGNSSVGIREAPFYGVNSINIGTRQNNRDAHSNITTIYHAPSESKAILDTIGKISVSREDGKKANNTEHFGAGDSGDKFRSILESKKFWSVDLQKQFCDIL